MTRIFATILGALLVAACSADAARAAEVKVLAVGALQVAMRNFAADFGKAGATVAVTASNPANFMKDMEANSYDVVAASILTIEELDEAGQLRPGSRYHLARTGIGLAVKEGAPKPDLSTVAAFKKTLMEAKSFVYGDPSTPVGSGVATQHILTNAGLLALMKTTGHQAGLGPGRDGIAKGDYDLGFFNVSEAAAPGIVLAGPVPLALQQYTDYDVAILKTAMSAKEAAAFIRALTAKRTAQKWRDTGLERLTPR